MQFEGEGLSGVGYFPAGAQVADYLVRIHGVEMDNLIVKLGIDLSQFQSYLESTDEVKLYDQLFRQFLGYHLQQLLFIIAAKQVTSTNNAVLELRGGMLLPRLDQLFIENCILISGKCG